LWKRHPTADSPALGKSRKTGSFTIALDEGYGIGTAERSWIV